METLRSELAPRRAGNPPETHPGLVLNQIKALARRYRARYARPLGVTGEIGELEAAERLGLTIAPARTAGYDATDAAGRRLQIKTRCLSAQAARRGAGRVPSIDVEGEFDAVLLVLLDPDYELLEILEADRADVCARLNAPGSVARNVRGSLGISQFRSIARSVYRAV